MPVQAIIAPDSVIAGGVRIGGQDFTVRHNQLSGNTEGKRRKLIERLQEDVLDSRMDESTLPVDDPERLDHADNAALGYNTYDDSFRRGDDSLIDERAFYWQQNPQKTWLIHREIYCDIELILVNDPTLGGNDRYSLALSST